MEQTSKTIIFTCFYYKLLFDDNMVTVKYLKEGSILMIQRETVKKERKGKFSFKSLR